MHDNKHDKHRNRMRDKYLNDGISNMTPQQILEIILFYAIPRKDTRPIAENLICKFGSLHGVFNADLKELIEVEGVGESAAIYLKLFHDVSAFSAFEKNESLFSVKQIGEYLRPKFIGETNEIALLLCLDKNMKVVSCVELSKGSEDSAELNADDIVVTAKHAKAFYAVLAHNHPGATAIPSKADIDSTVKIYALLKKSDIILLDHFVFADGDFISFRQSDLIHDVS